MTQFIPAYKRLLENGRLTERVAAAFQRLEACDLCARACCVNRLAGELGACHTGSVARVSSFGPHLGEERPLSGWRGSGTIFFTRCNLNCVYCQNADISQTDFGSETQPEDLAEIMLRLQHLGCHNINLVSPSHVVPQILAAIQIAAQAGLDLPIVYNTGGYDSLTTLRLLDGVIDIYMPDMKYADETLAHRYSHIPNYPEINQLALLEMHRQVGDLQINLEGIAVRGLLVRHLVLPGRLAGSEQILRFISQKLSKNTYLNLMDQYRPAYRAGHYPELNRRITPEEYLEAQEIAFKLGLIRLDKG